MRESQSEHPRRDAAAYFGASSLVTAAVTIASAVFVASWLGIVSRPHNQLATFWPTNALLLGILVREPRLARHPAIWLAAFIGYIGADMLAGDSLSKTLRLTAANMAGVVVGRMLFGRFPRDELTFAHPMAMLWVLLVCCTAATASALVGSLSGRALLQLDWLNAFGFWFSAELVSYSVLLPVVLLAPPMQRMPRTAGHWIESGRRRPLGLAPLAALLLSTSLATAVGGPGAIVFSVPALLWCALTYQVFPTSLATMALCVWTLVAIGNGAVLLSNAPLSLQDTISLRIGIALLAAAPLTVAGVNAARNRLLRELNHTASHDALTGVLSRGAFIRRARARLLDLAAQNRPATLILMDVDHFKRVNDAHGHAAGDEVLATFSERMRTAMRPDDLLGRFGGEEFAILLPDTLPEDGARIADRLRQLACADPIELEDGTRLAISVSIGSIAHREVRDTCRLESMLKHADNALYQAKASGRNRAIQAVPD